MLPQSPFLLRFALTTTLAASLVGAVFAQRYEPQALAQELLEDTPYADATSSTFDFEGFLDEEFLAMPIGLYDVRIPSMSLDTKTSARHCKEACVAFIDVQTAFLKWLDEGELEDGLLQDAEILREWIRGWTFEQLTNLAAASEANLKLLEAFEASDEVKDAAARLSKVMRSGAVVGLDRKDALAEPLILAPTRADFLAMTAFGGWLWPGAQNVFWDPGVTTWTHCTIDRYAVLALEYAEMGTQPGVMAGGLSMDYRYETGLEQQVGQLAAAALISNYYEGKLPNSIRDGLAVNLVIDVYDVCDTRVDGDLRQRETEAIEIFVPGGNPNGGILPKVDANSRWRKGGGEDRFVGILRSAQKNGAEMVKKSKAHKKNKYRKDKRRHFQLLDDDGAGRTAISGPHLGSAGAEFVHPDQAYMGDYVEFLRAYQTCFLHWLRTESTGKKSGASFASLLRTAAKMEGVQQLEGALADEFRVKALSSSDLSKKDLEGRFVDWLSKKR